MDVPDRHDGQTDRDVFFLFVHQSLRFSSALLEFTKLKFGRTTSKEIGKLSLEIYVGNSFAARVEFSIVTLQKLESRL